MRGTADPWAVLGIEPCDDFKRIRKAYTAKLKRTNPEDDPQGFMLLRQAYECLRDTYRLAQPPPTEPEWNVSKTVSLLVERITRVCCDDALKNSIDAWSSILKDEALGTLELHDELGDALFGFLTTGELDLSWEVWVFLEQKFRWRERRSESDVALFDELLRRLDQAVRDKRLSNLRHRQLFTLTESRAPLVSRYAWFVVVAVALVGLGASGSEPRLTLEDAAKRGDAQAVATILGERYLYGKGVPRDVLEAVNMFRIARLRNDQTAQVLLGDAYPRGLEGEPDGLEAASWRYSCAAYESNSVAQWRLGKLFLEGEGVPRTEVVGIKMLERAAAQGHSAAQVRLAELEKGETR